MTDLTSSTEEPTAAPSTWPAPETFSFPFTATCTGPNDELPLPALPPLPDCLAPFILYEISAEGSIPASYATVVRSGFTQGIVTLCLLGWNLTLENGRYRLAAGNDERGGLLHLRSLVHSGETGQHWADQVRARQAVPFYAIIDHLHRIGSWQLREQKAAKKAAQRAAAKRAGVAA